MVLLSPRQIWPVVTVSSALEEEHHLNVGTPPHVAVALIAALTVEDAVEVAATATPGMMTAAPGAAMSTVVTVIVVMTDVTGIVMMVTAIIGTETEDDAAEHSLHTPHPEAARNPEVDSPASGLEAGARRSPPARASHHTPAPTAGSPLGAAPNASGRSPPRSPPACGRHTPPISPSSTPGAGNPARRSPLLASPASSAAADPASRGSSVAAASGGQSDANADDNSSSNFDNSDDTNAANAAAPPQPPPAEPREPCTRVEALNDPNWQQAMQEEYDALIENKTWHLVPPSRNRNLIYCKWVRWYALATARTCAGTLRDDVEGPGPTQVLTASRLFVFLNHRAGGFWQTHSRTPVGRSSTTTTSTPASEMAEEPIKYEDLPPEHKKKYDDLKAIFEADLIGSFEKTRSHGIRFKGFKPEGVLEGIDLSLPSEEPCARKLTMLWLILYIGILRAW
ncbi:hypothetical protein QYE76_071744 [Lolium multiflorum]|uniref:Uncharacterized protein n=1 Tax=Lolium multiflorum TaxID=4521 RepID=A0AAD8SLG6_LOLMU|nr:hypothetical protein QYE76_071744 [Lolium multiflorum]